MKFKTVRATTQTQIAQAPCHLKELRSLTSPVSPNLFFSLSSQEHRSNFLFCPFHEKLTDDCSSPLLLASVCWFTLFIIFLCLLLIVLAVLRQRFIYNTQVCSGKRNYFLLNLYIIKTQIIFWSQFRINLCSCNYKYEKEMRIFLTTSTL